MLHMSLTLWSTKPQLDLYKAKHIFWSGAGWKMTSLKRVFMYQLLEVTFEWNFCSWTSTAYEDLRTNQRIYVRMKWQMPKSHPVRMRQIPLNEVTWEFKLKCVEMTEGSRRKFCVKTFNLKLEIFSAFLSNLETRVIDSPASAINYTSLQKYFMCCVHEAWKLSKEFLWQSKSKNSRRIFRLQVLIHRLMLERPEISLALSYSVTNCGHKSAK